MASFLQKEVNRWSDYQRRCRCYRRRTCRFRYTCTMIYAVSTMSNSKPASSDLGDIEQKNVDQEQAFCNYAIIAAEAAVVKAVISC